ncbi:2-amino-4-hydroxy-6-hydroxymethyldihydropteridine diphosphokinase [Maricaulaceae bacterium EIL42A08]|nr:2-amino-4-hydroxy-6-hydroxymethyldihydropteridine diphosphokinase [Maricaulaceae bacterium EIL42A08]
MPFGRLQSSNDAHQGIFVALGANKSYGARSPLENLQSALLAMKNAGVEIVAASKPWRTPAWPDPSDPPFVNACVQIKTSLKPRALMMLLHDIEQDHGRIRSVRNAPRSLDLDLIDYSGQVIQAKESGGLELPHPRATQRAFVLLPFRDIAPHWVDPVTGTSLDRLIARLPVDDRRACRPAGGVLCAAASGLKRGAQ